jgi:hypothetical protein
MRTQRKWIRRGSPMTAEQLLEQAALVVRDRRRTYGQPRELFERVAVRWSQVLGTAVTPAQAVQCMFEVKAARHRGLCRPAGGAARRCVSCARHRPTRIDPEAEKRAGWLQHGILVVAAHDPRLTLPKRRMLQQLGLKLTAGDQEMADERSEQAA